MDTELSKNDAHDMHGTVTDMYTRVNNELGSRYQPFLNYGYGYAAPLPPMPLLEAQDRDFQISAQLYHFVTSATSLHDKDIVEVGSGRGGGAYYMKKYCGARSVAGLEYLGQSVDIARSSFAIDGLSFVQGDAEQLPFDSASKDVVVNIESSHCYPNLDSFYSETLRILKPGGYFCYADLVTPEKSREIEAKLRQLPVELVRSRDITANVLASLAADNARKVALIKDMGLSDARAAWWLNEWACVGTTIWDELNHGQLVYVSYALMKM
ncbi:methyltransferase domain-containing protein [Massilia sp. CCM 8695]|uniref:Methyltransferase domain-containing protein n=1 Tax=Massilia frigida TaxID=2609281 RepID=A0ABX0NJT8_9BURK|nr:class I SAM-dependent methyltransferase [Massilia frigida]NHZ83645.1 methyltransferase domain-containing protein [Massilia frigida]